MKRFLTAFLACLALGGCHVAPPPTTGYLPPAAFDKIAVGQDPDLAAVQEAMMAFAYPERMQGRPAEMALAVASLDAMAGQFSTSGRWMTMDSITQLEMLEARQEIRGILGIPGKAPSQSVIDQLVAASLALDKNDEAAALAALSGPDFTKTPAQTLAILTHFPKAPMANVATMDANSNFFPPDSMW